MILMIDNYDSFTYNVVQTIRELDFKVQVIRNDQLSLEEISELQPEQIILSPGPCTPNEAGICLQVIAEFSGIIPILGICLGHQCIAQHFGGKIIQAKQIMHGKTSKIYHQQQSLFAELPSPFTATRYHSLVADPKHFPEQLLITAWTENENGELSEIMGLSHREHPTVGLQFHPESILTNYGHELINNFLTSTLRNRH